ncbi:hypothetical protein CFP56_043331 [Quercus suber]|uniref:Uncharacterized protein n=1 Tax=Quercus suber TaxID=58331 RepID=A0AAW0LJ64_QUESU
MELKMEEQEESARVGSESRKKERLIDVLTPYILCIITNFFLAGLIIVVKVSLEKGFSRYVLVPYGQAFGALTTGVLALLYERFPSNFSLLLATPHELGVQKRAIGIPNSSAASRLKDIQPSATIQVTGGTFEDEVSLSLERRLQSGTSKCFEVESQREGTSWLTPASTGGSPLVMVSK